MPAKKTTTKNKSSSARRMATRVIKRNKAFSFPALMIVVICMSILGYFVISTFAATSKYLPDPVTSSCPRGFGITRVGMDWQNEVSSTGTAPVYGPGKKRRGYIKLCRVWGFRVNRSIATNLNNMILAASKAGVGLKPVSKYSGWRSYNMQREIRGINGCPKDSSPSSACRPATAAPGTSNHEAGEALDFADSSTRNSQVHKWLKANASRFGFYNLPSEPWHWSRNGR